MKKMNKEQIAKTAHTVHLAYCKEMGILTQPNWDDINESHRDMVLDSVSKILSGEISSREESHKCFLDHKLSDGWVYGKEYSLDNKTNPRLVEFNDLDEEQKIKDALFFSCVSSFI